MASFYTVRLSGIKISVVPLGWRGKKILSWRPLKWIAYSAADEPEFELTIEVPNDYETEEAVVNIHEKGRYVADGWKDELRAKRGETKSEKFRPEKQHDEPLLVFDVTVAGRAGWKRLIRSRPLSDNFWFATMVVAIITSVFATILIVLWDIAKNNYGIP